MKKLNLSFLLVAFSILSFAQAPFSFKYQAVVRDNAGEILPQTEVSFKFAIREVHANGNIIYMEEHLITTNEFGIANLEIGNGTPVIGIIELLEWDAGNKFLEVKLDIEGGGNYISMGTTQLLSVPFALYAGQTAPSDKISDKDGDTYLTTEQTVNEDTIRIFIGGNERFRFSSKTIEPINNEESTILGKGAGPNWQKIDNTKLVHGNVFIGKMSGSQLTDGYENTACGSSALGYATEGHRNVAIGTATLYRNTGVDNTAIGWRALYLNTSGSYNTASGFRALESNTEGSQNSAHGYYALLANLTGSSNASFGYYALFLNSTGSYNVAFGIHALLYNQSGNSNVAVGSSALYNNRDRSNLVAIGDSALFHNNVSGIYEAYQCVQNTAIGSKALFSNTSGYSNSTCGFESLYSNTVGKYNTAVGCVALYSCTNGDANIAIGNRSLYQNTTGSFNTAIGNMSQYNVLSGYFNTAIGYNSGPSLNWISNTCALGNYTQTTASNQVRIGSAEITSIGGYSTWTTLNDKNFQKNFSDNVPGLDFILNLEPITYHLDVIKLKDFLGIPDSIQNNEFMIQSAIEKEAVEQSGFVAQDVEELAQSLGYNFSGVDAPKNENGIYGLRYAEFVVPLVKAVQEQQAEIENLKKRIADLEKKGIDKKINYKSF